MSVVLQSVTPLFAVIFLGFFAGRAGFLGEAGIRGLGAFVFNFAIPPHVFRLMAETKLDQITEWGFLGGYFLAQAIVFIAGAGIGRLVFGMRIAEMTIQAFGSAFSNGVMLALPLLLWLYGDAGGVPALLIITLDVIVFSSVTVLLELSRRGGGRVGSQVVGHAARSVLVNPIIMATMLGILYSLSGLALPGVVEQTLWFIGGAAAPSALFALGASLSLRRIAGSLGPAVTMVAAKLFLHPFLAFVAFAYLLELDPLWINAGVIFAACPVGLNVYVFAQHYEVAIETASSAILISTSLAMVTITALLLLLPPGAL
ncbi:MAG TPA: AEC family transporter [Geminicoccaceae bacterium]|nr:AEC family transporter [Geminicoccaceae bacterium]